MNTKYILQHVSKVLKITFGVVILAIGMATLVYASYFFGYSKGFTQGYSEVSKRIESLLNSDAAVSSTVNNLPTPTPQTSTVGLRKPDYPSWSGPELWEAVNKRRQELGVNALSNASELCTIASIRLNELLDLGKLDGHEGFGNLAEKRPDLKWIFEKYNISEFLVSGASSAREAVALWENTLGHKKLLTGGEYVWGCTYAQQGIGVAISAY